MSTTVTNRIDALFDRCRAERRAALVLYLTSGFPDEATTRRLLPVLAQEGADLIELGVPFSDPIADGPTIQRASTIALAGGMTFPKTLGLLEEFRAHSDAPVILFGALNPYLCRGLGEAARMAHAAGADGILATDLPVEESAELAAACASEGLHLINLVAPTTPDARVRQIAAASSGFLYCIARRGVTGAGQQDAGDAGSYLRRLRGCTDLPLALGFGISAPEHVRAAVAAGADAVVVGTALIDLVERTLREEPAALEERAGAFVRALAAELKLLGDNS